MPPPSPSWTTAIARGARKTCPRCGRGPLFVRFNVLQDRCRVCGLEYLEEQGALFGYMFLLDRGLFLFPLIALVFFRVYLPNAATIFYVVCAVSMVALVYTLPHRAGVGVALHYLQRRRFGGQAEGRV